ncbi:hypothetical protein OE88DRAFT_1141652 [Heliocybe sulcata]|uniref:BTB domain-containing protein n=1 Tax=Heliocybe sulcata TaxID=5364 RepID=A0A5C3N9I9_9AGAM|nr:hypothetical protein OE88DRAFT_1141652 [Heliocybe sulcata]
MRLPREGLSESISSLSCLDGISLSLTTNMDLLVDDRLKKSVISTILVPAERIQQSQGDGYLWSELCSIGFRCGISVGNTRSRWNGHYVYVVQICLDVSLVDTTLQSTSIGIDLAYPDHAYEEKIVQDYQPDPTSDCEPSWCPSRGWSSGDIELYISTSYSRPPPSLSLLGISRNLKKSLHSSISTAVFVDTAIFAFSRRHQNEDGVRVDTPVPTFASSEILTDHSPYFKDMLSKDSFSESRRGPVVATFPKSEQSYTDDYDYDSDSDLSDTEEDKYYEASTIADDAQSSKSAKHENSVGAVCLSKLGEGRTIVMRGVASKTLNSLVYYLYTGDISFAAPRSVKAAPVDMPPGASAAAAIPEAATDTTILDHGGEDTMQQDGASRQAVPSSTRRIIPQERYPCSPKSMYRFANMLELHELQQRSFDAIKSNLSKHNIVEEVFSRFTALYPDVLEMETQLLYTMRREKEVQDTLSAFMQKIAAGELPHAKDALAKVVLKLAASG